MVPFSDRVIHHAIINVLESVFERQFIYHTYACRKGKGTHAAARYAFKCAGRSTYFLKLDVRKYFDSIDHTVLKSLLCRIIKDTRCLELLFSVIDSYEKMNKQALRAAFEPAEGVGGNEERMRRIEAHRESYEPVFCKSVSFSP